MKKIINYLVVSTITILSFSGCQKDNTSSLTNKKVITLSSMFNVYSHGSQGWTEEDTVGIFSTSKALTQNNLTYLPSAVATYEEKEMKGKKYIWYNTAVTGMTDLKSTLKEKELEFKEGEHSIYAYTPFTKEASDYKHVPIPDITKQTHNLKEFRPYCKYGFYYANATIAKYSDRPVRLSAFKPLFSQITLPGVSCPDELKDKTCTKLVIKSERPLAYKKGATVDLSNLIITGEPVNAIEYNLPEPLIIKDGYSGCSINGTSYIMVAIPFKNAVDTEFEFIFTIDGKEYTMRAKPNKKRSSENNLNMIGNEGLK